MAGGWVAGGWVAGGAGGVVAVGPQAVMTMLATRMNEQSVNSFFIYSSNQITELRVNMIVCLMVYLDGKAPSPSGVGVFESRAATVSRPWAALLF